MVITDPLNSNLDARTFELMAIGVADHTVAIPEGSQQFQTIVPVSVGVGDVPSEVGIEAGIDLPPMVEHARHRERLLDPTLRHDKADSRPT